MDQLCPQRNDTVISLLVDLKNVVEHRHILLVKTLNGDYKMFFRMKYELDWDSINWSYTQWNKLYWHCSCRKRCGHCDTRRSLCCISAKMVDRLVNFFFQILMAGFRGRRTVLPRLWRYDWTNSWAILKSPHGKGKNGDPMDFWAWLPVSVFILK